MVANSMLHSVRDHGWLNGFSTLFSKENHQWWGTWQWLIQIVIWMAIVNGMLAMVTLASPKIKASQARQEISQVQATAARDTLEKTALMVFFVFAGLAPAVGVIIIAQDAIIGEKQTGTAAWVLSKPVSRSAFLLSKLSADSMGVLATMVIAQGVVAYFIYKAGTGINLPLSGFLPALGLLMLELSFYLSLTYMLGTLFRNRGPVIGIPMVLVFGNNLVGSIPWLNKVMPWNLVMDVGPGQPSLAVALASGQPLPTITPIIGTGFLILIFLIVALWRFQKEEF